MKQIDNPFIEESSHKRTAKLRRNIGAYLRRWPLFLFSLLLFLFAAWLYTRYLTPIYGSSIKVLIQDSKTSQGATSQFFGDMAITGSLYGGIDNEIQVMKSSRLLNQVVNNLNIGNSYYIEGKVIETEIYGKELPVLLKTYSKLGTYPQVNFSVVVNKDNILVTHDEKTFKTKLNQPFEVYGYTFMFYKNPKLVSKGYKKFNVSTIDPFTRARALQGSLRIGMVNEYSTVLEVYLEGIHKKKSEDILNELVNVYNTDAIKDKIYEFDKTEEFIEDRIAKIDSELGGIEGKKQGFQQANNVAMLEEEVGSSIGAKIQLENQLLDADTQLSLVNSYKGHIQGQGIDEILPSDISSTSGSTNSAVSSYNQLVIERNNLLSSGATENHPMVQNLTKSIKTAKSGIVSNIREQEKSLSRMRNNIASQLSEVTSFKRRAPQLTRISRDINREQQIKENLYLLLLEKREEAAISKAITTDKIKVMDPVVSTKNPVAPVKSNYYLSAVILGLLLPLVIIYSKELLRNKVETRDDLEELIDDDPIIGEIPRVTDEELKNKVVGGDLSTLSEAFRIMRTNVEFTLSKIGVPQDKGSVILVTSSIKGEGKTFVAMNYAHTLGQLKDKKTVIIGSDIRNPQLHRYENIDKNVNGLTEYLYDDSESYKDFIHISKSDGRTHIMFSGRIPPNPTEMLMSDKFARLIKKLKSEYDYIIVDSAPLVLVSDTFHISNLVDLTIYVTRSEFTPKAVLRVPLEAKMKGRLQNLTFVLNDISTAHSGYAYGYKYNYGYGYGYGTKNRRRSFWSRLMTDLGFNRN